MNSVDGVRSTGQVAPLAPSQVPVERLPEQQNLIKAVKALNAVEYFDQNSELTFIVDRETRRPVVRIVDKQTNEVIRQIPPEYVLQLAEELKSAASGRG
ncbi:MAG TPA: flagellar protein FlaG [Bryobacteraceae bacterium]|nr:flagellar protein FlaG [Bryobacteraceae bacterium]